MPVAETEDRPRAPHIRNRPRDFVANASVSRSGHRAAINHAEARRRAASLSNSPRHIRKTASDVESKSLALFATRFPREAGV
jgi:hypothetical protein